jgi:hypothetical protein
MGSAIEDWLAYSATDLPRSCLSTGRSLQWLYSRGGACSQATSRKGCSMRDCTVPALPAWQLLPDPMTVLCGSRF